MSAFVEQWGRALEGRGYTQLSNLLLRRWREIGLSRTERDLIIEIISYQSNHETIPSLRQAAYEAGQCYQTARKNLKHLCAFKKDGGLGLLIPVLLPRGRTRYNMMPLRRALEKLEKTPALQVVKPAKVRPAPMVTIHQPDPDAAYQKAWQEVDEDAVADWEEVKEQLRREPDISPAAFDNWIAPTRGDHWEDRTLVVAVFSSGHVDVLERWRVLIKRTCQRMFGNISIAFKVLAAAALPI